MGLEHDLGIIFVCAMCESYFVLGVTSVDYTKYRGREGTRQLEEYYMSIQTRHEQQKWAFQRCPTCIECATGKRYLDWLASTEPAILTLCRAASFEDGQPPPLYIQETVGKDRWTLAQGVGPKTLELDKSRSGRLYKPAIRNVLPDSAAPMYTPSDAAGSGGPTAHASMLSAVEAALSRTAKQGSNYADALAESLLQCSPVFTKWAAASEALDAAEAVALAEEEAGYEAGVNVGSGQTESAAVYGWD
jgi:hypothetical protein